MAKVTEIKFTRRYRTGDYEHEEYTATATLDEGDNAVEEMIQLKEDVAAAYGGAAPAEPEGDDEEDTPAPKKKAAKKKSSKKTAPVVEEDEDEEDEEEEIEEDEESDDEEESEDESEDEDEEEEQPRKKKAAKKAGAKKFKKKPQTYDRENDTHKDILGNLLKSIAPDWKKSSAGLKLAKEASMKLDSRDFLDAEGEVLPEFKKLLAVYMGKKK